MTRRSNVCLWLGFACVLAGLFSYQYLIRFPITRDFPWLNLLLLAAGIVLFALGLVRAFGNPTLYRGKIYGSIMAALSVAGTVFFLYVTFFLLKNVPASTAAPRVGERAPSFTLPDQDGRSVSLTGLLSSSGTRAAILIFYRGHW